MCPQHLALDLGWNKLGEKGASHIIDAVQSKRCAEHLTLQVSGSDWTQSAVDHLNQALSGKGDYAGDLAIIWPFSEWSRFERPLLWARATHRSFPGDFQELVRLLLLIQKRWRSRVSGHKMDKGIVFLWLRFLS